MTNCFNLHSNWQKNKTQNINKLNYLDYNQYISTGNLILLIGLTILLIRFIWIFVQFCALYKKEIRPSVDLQQNISVLICARNEAENLKKHIPLICRQKYPSFEVLIVNDASTDNTERVINELENKFSNLRHTIIPKDSKFDHGKKLAMTIGIKASKYDQLVLTDADCEPVGEYWLAEMAASLNVKPIVLGYGAYKTKKGLLNKLIRFDTFQIAANYLTSARIGLPYMGVGRNMAYKKEIYQNAQGFKKHYHIESGDDDLLINQMARRKNTIINIEKNCITYSQPKSTFKQWFLQKTRHLGAGSQYRFIHKLHLGIIWTLTISTLPLLIILNLINSEFILHIHIFTATYLLVYLLFSKFIMKKLNEKGFLLLIPIFELIISIFPLYIITKTFLKKKQSKWS